MFKGTFLKYEFVVELLEDMPDPDVHDVFARINTYAEKLTAQELRNAKWFGEFKSTVYALAVEVVTFFETMKVFTSHQILRMGEAEFISELLLAMEEGIREGNRTVIDKAYKDYDDTFPNRARHARRFKETIDIIGNILGDELPNLEFRATRLFYPLFCAVYHMQFNLSKLQAPRQTIKTRDYPKVKTILEEVDQLIKNAVASNEDDEEVVLSVDERKFYEAYDEHWVHAANRTVLTQYLCKQFTK
jgi:hypothetical protein